MYIWLAIDVSDQLSDLRQKASLLTKDLGAANTALTLPPHISLRISFFAEDSTSDEIIERVRAYFKTLPPFSVQVEGIENFRGIIWLKVKSDPKLQKIHTYLTDLTAQEYSIPPHMFDSDYHYHVSLFTGSDPSASEKFFLAIENFPVPQTIEARKYIIGVSKTGRPDDYRVIHTVCAEKQNTLG